MSSFNVFAAALLAFAAVTAPVCQARLLKRWEDIGDPSGYSAQVNSRSFVQGGGKTRYSLTPEAAEATTNAAFQGLYRFVGNRASFSTVEADPMGDNPDRRKELVKPRARSAQDLPRGGVNMASGAPQVPALVMGGAAAAQTYMGATSVATSDSVWVNRGKKNTVVSNNYLTASTGTLNTGGAGSFGVTSQPIRSMALSGPANGRIQLAQADQAVAMAATEKPNKWDRMGN